MPTYAKGTLTEFCDVNQNVIAVGDKLRAEDGSLWTINRYLQAVPDGPGLCINKLAAFVHQHKPVIVDDEEPIEPTEAPEMEKEIATEPDAHKMTEDTDINRAWRLEISDAELAEELRSRGFTVTAKKTIVIEL